MKSFTIDSSATTHWISIVLAWTSLSGLASIAMLALQDPWSRFYLSIPLAGVSLGCYIGVLHAVARRFSHGSTLSARLMAWSALYSLNLIIPLIVALQPIVGPWRFGMAAALAVLFALGCLLCRYAQAVSRRLIAGTGLLAFVQFFPVAQLYAVSLSLEAVATFGIPTNSVTCGLLTTLLASTTLLVVATVFGCLMVEPLPSTEQRSAMGQSA